MHFFVDDIADLQTLRNEIRRKQQAEKKQPNSENELTNENSSRMVTRTSAKAREEVNNKEIKQDSKKRKKISNQENVPVLHFFCVNFI